MNKTRIKFTTCPRCSQPLAAVTVGDSRACTWLLARCGWVDLDSEPLTWCPTCNEPLAVLPALAAAVAGDERMVQP